MIFFTYVWSNISILQINVFMILNVNCNKQIVLMACPYNPNNHFTSLILTMKCDTTLFQTKIKLWSIMDNDLVLIICLGFGSCLFLIICWTCYYLSTSFSSWKSAGMKNSEDAPEISQNDTLNHHGYRQGQFLLLMHLNLLNLIICD